MTLANKITISRFFFIPLMIIFAILGNYVYPFNLNFDPVGRVEVTTNLKFFEFTIGHLITLILFMAGSFTDFLDGYFARKRNEVTTFGKFIDPILDKLITLGYLSLLLLNNYYYANSYHLVFIIVSLIFMLAREFLVTGLRLVSMEKNKVIPAGKVGKAKTAFLMISLIYMGFNGFSFTRYTKLPFDIVGMTLLSISTLLTIASGIIYFVNGKDVLKKAVCAENKNEEIIN